MTDSTVESNKLRLLLPIDKIPIEVQKKVKGAGPREVISESYPYRTKIDRARYERQKAILQIELLRMQRWVEETGQRVVLLFEGRDAAGKGGTIKRFLEHLNPRNALLVALSVPSERERGQWYFQRYVQHLPSRGELVFFDRSWYNRAVVSRCTVLYTGRKPLFLERCNSLRRAAGQRRLLPIQVLVFGKSRGAATTGHVAREGPAQAVEN